MNKEIGTERPQVGYPESWDRMKSTVRLWNSLAIADRISDYVNVDSLMKKNLIYLCFTILKTVELGMHSSE